MRAKRFTFIVGLGLALLVVWLLNFHYFTGLDEQAEHCAVTHFYADGSSVPVFGAEDIEIDHDAGLAFISAVDFAQIHKEFAAGGVVETQGGIYVWDMVANPPGSEPIHVTDISRSIKQDGQFRPHGISMLKVMNGYRFGIVNHAYPTVDGVAQSGDEVLLADYVDGQLSVTAKVRHSLMCSPNDLALVDESRFFVSNDHGACTPGAKALEETLGLKHAYLLYYDGDTMQQVARNIAYANGVSLSPDSSDPMLYVSATREEKLYRFDADKLMRGDLRASRGVIDLPFSPDNITWDERGALIVSGFPNLYRFLAHRKGMPGFDATPAAALRIAVPGDDGPDHQALFADNSGMINGATVAAVYRDKMIATSVFDDRVLVCDSEAP